MRPIYLFKNLHHHTTALPTPSPLQKSLNTGSLRHLPDILIWCAFLPPKKTPLLSTSAPSLTSHKEQQRSDYKFPSLREAKSLVLNASLAGWRHSFCPVLVKKRLWRVAARAAVHRLRAAVFMRRCVHAPWRVLTPDVSVHYARSNQPIPSTSAGRPW